MTINEQDKAPGAVKTGYQKEAEIVKTWNTWGMFSLCSLTCRKQKKIQLVPSILWSKCTEAEALIT